jgi:hypothetical protein
MSIVETQADPEAIPALRFTETELAELDRRIVECASTLESSFAAAFGVSGAGYAAISVWIEMRPTLEQRLCDCPRDPYHRWNCTATPIWTQTMRDLDLNPWTAVRLSQ